MTTFPNEKEATYISTLLVQNNLGEGHNKWQKIQPCNTYINKWRPYDDYIHILCLALKLPWADTYYKPAAAPAIHSTEAQGTHIKTLGTLT